jgi:SAM-dependent methyltransferase
MLSRPPLGLESFGTFDRAEASPVALLDGYRDLVKRRWRGSWWPVGTLLALDRDGATVLPPALSQAAALINSSRTLAVPPEDIAKQLSNLAQVHPDYFSAPTRHDPRYGTKMLEPAGAGDPDVDAYRRGALEVQAVAAANGLALRKSRVLDVGCASGFHSFALGAVAGEVVGIDLDVETYAPPTRRARARSLLLPEEDEERVRIEEGDVTALAYPDASFDVVVSNTVLEHVHDLAAAFREIRRVLRPGGVSFHGVQPWFGPEGGHSLCTLDFPWGHVRLTDEDFAAYTTAWRPLEAADAIANHRNGFQQPRLTLEESRKAVGTAGLEIIHWRETSVSLRDVHSGLVTSALLEDCRRLYPHVTKRDLLTIGYSALLRRR